MKTNKLILLLLPFTLSGCFSSPKYADLKTGVFVSDRLVVFKIPDGIGVDNPIPFPSKDEAQTLELVSNIESVKITCRKITNKEYYAADGINVYIEESWPITTNFFEIKFEIKLVSDEDYVLYNANRIIHGNHYKGRQSLVISYLDRENKTNEIYGLINFEHTTSFDHIHGVFGKDNFSYLTKISD